MADSILTEVRGRVGIMTLNAPKSLNSLSLSMIEDLLSGLNRFRDQDEISCVVLAGAGEKAFCAGGDVRRLYQALKEQEPKTGAAPEAIEFFTKEYRLDYAIHKFKKPILVLADGIVMGGGMGLLMGASHRLVTERTKLAMPEVTIGLYPDVGGSWFLNRLPRPFGAFLGLCGARLNAGDGLYFGFANHYLPSELLSALWQGLTKLPWSDDGRKNHELLSELLLDLRGALPLPESTARSFEEQIHKLAPIDDVREFHKKGRDLLTSSDPWAAQCYATFAAGSPSSAAIIVEQLKRCQGLSLAEVFRSELNLSVQCTLHPDFKEGVRALLVDKDGSPKWSPASLEELTSDWLDSYFQPLWDADTHPLRNLEKEDRV